MRAWASFSHCSYSISQTSHDVHPTPKPSSQSMLCLTGGGTWVWVVGIPFSFDVVRSKGLSKLRSWAGEMTKPVEILPCKHKNLSLNPLLKSWASWHGLVISALGWQSQPGLSEELQTSEKIYLKNRRKAKGSRAVSEGWHPNCTLASTYILAHIWTHTHANKTIFASELLPR